MTPEEIDALGAKVNGLVMQSADYGKRLDVLGLNLANLDAGVNAGLYQADARLSEVKTRLDRLEAPSPPSKVWVWVKGRPKAILASFTASPGLWVIIGLLAMMLWNQWTPGPGPVPPGPNPLPPPIPGPVDPSDTLWKPLKAAWSAETASDKRDDRDDLARLYLQGVQLADDTSITKVLDLKNMLKAARVNLMGEALAGVRQVLNDESLKVLPSATDAPLDQPTRAKAAALFARYADLLRRLP